MPTSRLAPPIRHQSSAQAPSDATPGVQPNAAIELAGTPFRDRRSLIPAKTRKIQRPLLLAAITMEEEFVVQAVEQWLSHQGFGLVEGAYNAIDAAKGNRRWQIEAKGEPAASGTDFHTGLGQIIVRATDRSEHYGLAMPNTTEYRRSCAQGLEWLHQALKLHWLLVSEDGSMEVVPPA